MYAVRIALDNAILSPLIPFTAVFTAASMFRMLRFYLSAWFYPLALSNALGMAPFGGLGDTRQ